MSAPNSSGVRIIKMQPEICGIYREGQRYFDTPIYLKPVKRMDALSSAMAEIHGHIVLVPDGDGKIRKFRTDLPRDIFVGHQRTYLRWRKPDGKGGLIPK